MRITISKEATATVLAHH